MGDRRGSTPHEDSFTSPFANFALPPPRESSRFSTTYSFYEFIDQELKEDEERDMLILKVRENIIGSLVEELYNRYMDRQVIPFTVRCFLQSLKRVMNWYFFPRDPEDTRLDWERDEPLPPVPVDNWASYCIPPGEYPPKIKFSFKSLFEEKEEDEGEDEEVPGEDYLDFDQPFASLEDDLGDLPRGSIVSPTRSLSLPDFDLYDDVPRCESPAHVSATLKSESKLSSSKIRRAHFASPTDTSTHKIRREINQWINPKTFPPVRVCAGLTVLPGEKFSGKTCGRKHVTNKSITIRPAKPTTIKAQEIRRSYTV